VYIVTSSLDQHVGLLLKKKNYANPRDHDG